MFFAIKLYFVVLLFRIDNLDFQLLSHKTFVTQSSNLSYSSPKNLGPSSTFIGTSVSTASVVAKSDEVYEEIQHSDGKVFN